jgi:hypothetical protein
MAVQVTHDHVVMIADIQSSNLDQGLVQVLLVGHPKQVVQHRPQNKYKLAGLIQQPS